MVPHPHVHYFSANQFATRLENDVNGNPIYIGETYPNKQHKTSKPCWRIRKLIYDGSGFNTAVLWADDNENFDKVWDNRATYTYGT